MPPPTRRLFVAIDAPPAVSDSLAALAQPVPGLKWTRPDTLHLTLRFIGDTQADAIDTLAARLRAVRVAPFALTIGGVGVFPRRGAAQVVWAGIEQEHPRLHQLRQRVDDAILAAGLAPDMRSFHPHFTLARCAGAAPGAVHDFVHTHAGFQGATFTVDRFHLFESRLQPAGAEHTIVETFVLAPG